MKTKKKQPMEMLKKLPMDIQTKMFIYFIHPAAKIIKIHNSYRGKLMEDIRDYPKSLKKLYNLPFAIDHNGFWGSARLLTSLWMYIKYIFGDYYKIWKRMYYINSTKTAKQWVGRLSIYSHKYQIKTLWSLFTPNEKKKYLLIQINR